QSQVVLGVMISKLRTRQTKRGDMMAFIEVEDPTGNTEVVVFPKTYAEYRELMHEDAIVLVQGTTEEREESVQVRADGIIPIEDAFEKLGRRLGVRFTEGETDENELFRLKDILQRHRGGVPVSLIFERADGARWVVRSNEDLSVKPSGAMLEELKSLVGSERIRVDRN
ncbi:MAG: OB-fold nucleic acid binding domain-containing protein, partial [Planctomycetota bacterium]